jgi:aldehyde dehydrogenase (NAD+)
MTFRTPSEAVEIANNTRYGLAASIWSENINLALDIAPKVKAGSVWINCTNLFDASSGFGGYRESGFGREGGKEGLYEYLRPSWDSTPTISPSSPLVTQETFFDDQPEPAASPNLSSSLSFPAIDRTPKLFIAGKQVRPDSGYTLSVSRAGTAIGEVGEGNRKDIRNAVEAAHKASSWASATTHNRAQILYYLAENLSIREEEFARRIVQQTGQSLPSAHTEVQTSLSRLFTYAAWADKFEGSIHRPPLRGVTLALPEPIGVLGIACPDDYPLLAFISLLAPAIAMGNAIIIIPSPLSPLSATDCYQVFETSDLPPGVVNIVTGDREQLTHVLAEHEDVDALWYFGTPEGSKQTEFSSAVNMKRTWVNYGLPRNWSNTIQGEGQEFLRQSTQVKNIWIPYGE